MIHIIYAYFGAKSCAKIAKMIGAKTHNTLREGVEINDENDIAIRWGSVHPIKNEGWTRNKRRSILDASLKRSARMAMQRAGISVPKTYDNVPADAKFPLIGRPDIHAKGQLFVVCKNMKDVDEAKRKGCTYFSEVFDKTHEYRVHVASGKVLYVQTKNFNGELRGDFPDDIQWQILYWNDYTEDVCRQAIKAVQCFDLDFAAVDIMWNDKAKTACVCEVNTAPEVAGDLSRSKYAKYFKWLEFVSKSDSPRQMWDSSKLSLDQLPWKDKDFEQEIPKKERTT